MSQNTSAAVMQQRAPEGRALAEDPQRALWRKLDFFPTPPWAARAGAELIRDLESRRGMAIKTMRAWEPACGQGHIAAPLGEYFAYVHMTDIHNYGPDPCGSLDFLRDDYPHAAGVEWIITNPPFLTAAAFVERGLELATRGVAVLCRQAFIESEKRFGLLFGGAHPLTVFAPFCERVAMQLGSWDPEGSTATAYAWFVFHKPATQISPLVIPIPPGSKTRLTRADDVRRFARAADRPLLPHSNGAVPPEASPAAEARHNGD